MSDEKIVKEIDDIKEEDLIPNPPKVNSKVMYYLVIFGIILAVLSALAVVFDSGNKTNTTEMSAYITETVQYII